jgi:hypothetical protein
MLLAVNFSKHLQGADSSNSTAFREIAAPCEAGWPRRISASSALHLAHNRAETLESSRQRAQILAVVFVIVVAAATHGVSTRATEVRTINVYVTCDGSDSVGGHLCFAVKEQVITSVGFQLVDGMTAKTGIGVHLVSVDAGPTTLPKGVTSAVSVTFTFFGGPIEYYDGAQVFLVGSKKITEIASDIFSAVERRATKLRG